MLPQLRRLLLIRTAYRLVPAPPAAPSITTSPKNTPPKRDQVKLPSIAGPKTLVRRQRQ